MIGCLVAVEKNQGIGFKKSMPWPHLKDDMKWFQSITTDHIVVMGRTTWETLGKPLPNRINVVVSSQVCNNSNYTFSNPTDAIYELTKIHPNKHIFIIGGQALYDSTMHLIDKFYITRINANYECDKFFNLSYIQEHCSFVKEHAKYETPIPYTINEYTK